MIQSNSTQRSDAIVKPAPQPINRGERAKKRNERGGEAQIKAVVKVKVAVHAEKMLVQRAAHRGDHGQASDAEHRDWKRGSTE